MLVHVGSQDQGWAHLVGTWLERLAATPVNYYYYYIGSRGVQANTWEWMRRMSQTRQSMQAVQTKHRWVGMCMCACVTVCVCDSPDKAQVGWWVCACVCVPARVCASQCVSVAV